MKSLPSSVYRLQLSKSFNLKKATALLPYLKKLGIDGVYCSPYFKAYSPHGYDITDPTCINPQIGSKRDFDTFCKELKKHNIFHIADIVPNHMGIKGDNPWWQDVLKHGKHSQYAKFFDINWDMETILVPLLGEPLEEALKKKKLKKKGKYLCYADQQFPLEGIEHYRLADWLLSAQETSYRRFFNINELIGLRIEDKEVFDAYHKFLFELIKEEKIDGLRIDHPDGLYDPKAYFDRIRQQFPGPIFVEKILGWKEEIPSSWQVDGTVGYEYLNLLSGLFVKKNKALTDVYTHFIGKPVDFEQILYEKKIFYMATEMAGDIRSLCERLYSFTSKMRSTLDIPQGDIIKALYELLAYFPVYRSYIRLTGKISREDKSKYEIAFTKARASNRELGHRVFDLLEDIFFLKIDTPYIRDFILRFQQLSAPIMAKGFEDITLYNYNRLLTLNEVGSEPDRFGVTVEEFHSFNKRKQQKWPLGLLTTSTHDTKRSLDTRMQIAVLSEIPKQWQQVLVTWSALNAKHKTQIYGELYPEPNMEYFLYQTLLGVWPSNPSFERLWTIFQKSIREARVHTSWRHPNTEYEKACEVFLQALLKPKTPFQKSFQAFQKMIQEYGEWNSLSATALKLGSPGIIDVYQGCEYFHYTLVDPDNRIPINYSRKDDLKFRLHQMALEYRSKHKDLFLHGKYIPIIAKGPDKDHIIAYLRTHNKKACLVVGTRHTTTLSILDATIELPKDLGRGVELFSDCFFDGKTLEAKELLKNVPFAWLCW